MFTSNPLSGDVRMVLLAMGYLLVKHCLADFLLQTENQRLTKGDYGAAGGIAHSLTHIAATAPVFLLLPQIGFGEALTLLAGEFVAHYHIDWLKEQVIRHNGWTTQGTPFWWALGIDQLAHGLTYVALLGLSFSLAAGVSAGS